MNLYSRNRKKVNITAVSKVRKEVKVKRCGWEPDHGLRGTSLLRGLDYIFRVMGSHWRGLSK